MIKSLVLIFSLTATLYAQPDTLNVHWQEKDIPVLHADQFLPNDNKVLDFFVDDINHDGRQEAVILNEHKDHPALLSIYDYRDRTYFLPQVRLPYKNEIKEYVLFPIKNHPLYRAVVYARRKDHGMLLLLNHNLQLADSIKTIRGYGKTDDKPWDGYMHSVSIVDLNGDLRPDLLCAIKSGGDGQPRALLGYDLLTKKTVLNKRFAPMIGQLEPVDFYQDGHPKLLLVLNGAADGPSFGQFKRDATCLVLMETDGSVIKFWECPGIYGYIYYKTLDINSDHCLDIIAIFYDLENSGFLSNIKIIDGKTLEILTSLYSHSANQFMKIDILHDYFSRDKIITRNQKGDITILCYNPVDTLLTIERSLSIPDTRLWDICLTDLNQDGRDEIVGMMSSPRRLYILDSELSPLLFVPLDSLNGLTKIRSVHYPSCQNPGLLFMTNKKLYRVELSQNILFPSPPLTIRLGDTTFTFTWWPVLPGSLVTLFLFGFVLHMTKKKNKANMALCNSKRVAALLISPNSRIEWINTAFMDIFALQSSLKGEKIENLFKTATFLPLEPIWQTFQETDSFSLSRDIQLEKSGDWQTVTAELSRLPDRRIQLLLIDVTHTAQTERLQMWTALAQRLVHKTKTPLGSIMLAVQRMKKVAVISNPDIEKDISPTVTTILEELQKVRTDINNFLKFSRLEYNQPKQVDVCRMVNDIVEARKRGLPESIKMHAQLESESIFIHVDEKQIAEAINNVIDNARQAIESQGNILITTQFSAHPLKHFGGKNQAIIEIIDDGMGISKDVLDKVFTKGYTTNKFGSGMGLMICKTIVEQNGGEMTITSRENIGTTVTFVFPNTRRKSDKEE